MASAFQWLEFDKDGGLVDSAAPAAIMVDMARRSATDLVIISHGWKTDQAGAQALYTPLLTNVGAALAAVGGLDPAKVAAAGVLWPSKEYRTDFDQAAANVPSDATLSVAAPAAGDGDLAPELLDEVIADFIDLVGPAGQAVRDAACHTAAQLSPHNAKVLLQAAKSLVVGSATYDSELADDALGLDGDPHNILLSLFSPPAMIVVPTAGRTLGIGSVLTNALMGPRAAVARLLNQFTYFEMKKRAGVVGQQLGTAVAPKLGGGGALRVHLIGHSFGARLVTAAAAAFSPAANARLASLTLLQGAYSHNGLASTLPGGGAGAFRIVLEGKRVGGAITITHTHNDSACTVAYPLASRLSRDTTSALGDANDMFGAMGANGAQHLATGAYAPDLVMAKGAAAYAVQPGLVNNALGDACISEHMDVTNVDVGALVASALKASL